MLCCGYTLTDFPISIRLTSLALWQSNDCPSASKATLMNMDKYFMWVHYERLHNHNNAKHNKTVFIFLGIYCRCSICLNADLLHFSNCASVSDVTINHDDVIKRKHFPRYSLFVRGIRRCLCGEFTGHRWIPLTKASDVELWCFLWSAPEQRLSKQSSKRRWLETLSRSLWRHCNGIWKQVSI